MNLKLNYSGKLVKFPISRSTKCTNKKTLSKNTSPKKLEVRKT
jgi:hypothetical protein